MPVLDAHHDFAHPVEGDTAWSESWYFNAYSPASDTGFFTRIGVRPNEGTIDVGLHVWLPGNALAAIRGVREQRDVVDGALEVAGVRYERVAPMRRWRIVADAEARVFDLGGARPEPRRAHVVVDATFEALIPAIGVDGQGPGAGAGAQEATSATVGKGHLEQAGRWTGSVELDGARHELTDARGNRDKSWGPRRWGGPRMWRWFSVNVGDDVHFGGIRIGTDAGDLHRGWVWRDGGHSSIREWRVETELAGDGVTHRTTRVRATDKAGRVHELSGEILRVAPGTAGIRPSATIVNEGLARWTYEGRVGYGIAEYLHQLDEQARPVVPIE
jgi:hypothetical protein